MNDDRDDESEAEDFEPREELARIISLLIDSPRQARLTERHRGKSLTYVVRVADDDLGKLIGRQGRTARALRALLEARAELDERRYGLEIRES
ncbi:MAG: KH domain-containing protein [Thermoanaerobaculia bacterium]